MRSMLVLFCAALPLSAIAAPPSEIDALRSEIQAMRTTLGTLENRLHNLERENATLRSSKEAPTLPAAAPAAIGSTPGRLVPDIGVVADMTAALTQSHEDSEGNDKLSVREIELVIGHDIDPYSRFDSTITVSDFEDVGIEEAYVSLWDLPGGLTSRLGRMRQKIGRASAVHRDQLPSVDEPLVVQRYLGVEGLFKTGLEVARFLPSFRDTLTHEVIVGVMEGGIGEEGALFGETRRYPSYYARLRNSLDFSERTAADIGGTFLSGSSDDDSRHEVRALGADITLVQHLSPVQKLTLQAEALFQRRDTAFFEPSAGHAAEEASDGDLTPPAFRRSPWGMYVLADYRMNERWSLGGRWDYVQAVNRPEGDFRTSEEAFSAMLTYHQSEFARWRFQFQRARLLDGEEDNRIFLQGNFAIGTHKHQLQ